MAEEDRRPGPRDLRHHYNHCCETTARVGRNLGHDVWFVVDATHTFDRRAPDGQVVTADELARVTAANLHGEFATVVTTDQLVG